MKYFAYENWRAHGHITKVHRHDCPFCNDGMGMAGGTRPDNGQWLDLGEFERQEDALAAARTRVAQGTVRLCGACSERQPERKLRPKGPVIMHDLSDLVGKSVTDFLRVSSLAGAVLRPDQVDVEILAMPHKPPPRLPEENMAVYAFFLDGRALKVGKAGPNSHARYSYQHYNASSAASTLAGSLMRNPAAVGIEGIEASNIGQWIREHTDRVNLLLPENLGDPILSLLEAYLHVRWNPVYEGRG